MFITEEENARKYRYARPNTPEETLSAIHEELSVTPLAQHDKRPQQTVKGYLSEMLAQMRADSRGQQASSDNMARSEAASLAACGLLGLVMVLVSSNVDSDWTWWRTYSYFFFAVGTVITAMFVAASIERSSVIARMLKFNSVKILSAFVFSAALVYASSQASSLLNDIFGVDAASLPYTRAIISAVYFLKMCQPFLLVLAAFVLVHILAVWGATKVTNDIVLLPWNSILFVIGAVLVAGAFQWITNGAFGDEQIKRKAYKLAHYLDFSKQAYCVEPSKEQRYLFFGQDQNKVLIDRKLGIEESFEAFLKGGQAPGEAPLPSVFRIEPCSPERPRAPALAPVTQ